MQCEDPDSARHRLEASAPKLMETRKLGLRCTTVTEQSSPYLPLKVKMAEERVLVAAVEAGGTTWVAALAWEDDMGAPFERIEVPTTTNPAETISAVRDWLRKQVAAHPVRAVGVASFGPIDPKPESPTYGHITSTPKPGWGNTDVVGGLGLGPTGEFASLPHRFDTDVNGPALAEFIADCNNSSGSGGGSDANASSSNSSSSSAYVTVGTGVGAGLVVNRRTVAGLLHPEAGHIPVRRKIGDDYAGCCPFHGDCLEGMVCSRAIAERAGVPASELAGLEDSHPVWDSAAYYLAQLAVNMVLLASVEKVVFGGGIFNRSCLYDKIRSHVSTLLNGYIQVPALTTKEGLQGYVARSRWGLQAGLIGAVFLAVDALKSKQVKA